MSNKKEIYPREPSEVKRNIARVLKEERKKREKEQADFAKLIRADYPECNMSQPKISALEKEASKGLPHLETLLPICNYLGCNIDHLLKEDMDAKTYTAKEISNRTALSVPAVEMLIDGTANGDQNIENKGFFASKFIESSLTDEYLQLLYEYTGMQRFINRIEKRKEHARIARKYLQYRHAWTSDEIDKTRTAFVESLCSSLDIPEDLMAELKRDRIENLRDKVSWMKQDVIAIGYSIDPAKCYYREPNTKRQVFLNDKEITPMLAEKYRGLSKLEKQDLIERTIKQIDFYEYEQRLQYEYDMPAIETHMAQVFMEFINQACGFKGGAE